MCAKSDEESNDNGKQQRQVSRIHSSHLSYFQLQRDHNSNLVHISAIIFSVFHSDMFYLMNIDRFEGPLINKKDISNFQLIFTQYHGNIQLITYNPKIRLLKGFQIIIHFMYHFLLLANSNRVSAQNRKIIIRL